MHTAHLKKAIGLFGASGFSGIEATRILGHHPSIDLRFVTSDRWEGRRVKDLIGNAGAASHLTYISNTQAENLASQCEVVLLATPNEASLNWVPRLLNTGSRMIDFSGTFRLKDSSLYPRFYGFNHSAPGLLSQAVYGLPELFRKGIADAQLIANPGCYATAATLALAPLLKDGLIESTGLIVDAASGVTGAGRKASEDFSFAEVDGNFSAYGVLKHRHTPEIRQTLRVLAPPTGEGGGDTVGLTFTPHLLPVKRGILATCYARAQRGTRLTHLQQSLGDFYRDEPFVQLMGPAEKVHLKNVVGTNLCALGLAFENDEDDPDRVIVVSAIDNLVKGAAGQAVQNLNLMLGFEETTGLLPLRGTHP